MKLIWLHIVRAYIRLGLFFYYKRIHVYGKNQLPKGKSLLFLANHQNALIDALLIATTSGRFSYFLTRAGVFKKPFVRKILGSFNMLPVYRIRDGWSTISNNNSIFTRCVQLLKEKQNIFIFPEGSHSLNRTVRPLSKGFTRIVFETLERYPEVDLQLIPIGLNFQNATEFGDSTAIYYGKPIEAKAYLHLDPHKNIVNLKHDVHQAIQSLTTHIPSENYSETIGKLDDFNVNYLKPSIINDCIATNFEKCKPNPKPKNSILKNTVKLLFSISIIGPVLVWKFNIKPKIDEIEFMSTFRFAVGITLVPIWIILISIVLGIFWSAIIGVSVGFTIIIMGLLAVKI